MATKPRFEVFVFTMEGSGKFPLDMLRYDSCAPSTEFDAAAIAKDGQRRVTLRRFYPVGGSEMPTLGRWESFGWKYVAINQRTGHFSQSI